MVRYQAFPSKSNLIMNDFCLCGIRGVVFNLTYPVSSIVFSFLYAK